MYLIGCLYMSAHTRITIILKEDMNLDGITWDQLDEEIKGWECCTCIAHKNIK